MTHSSPRVHLAFLDASSWRRFFQMFDHAYERRYFHRKFLYALSNSLNAQLKCKDWKCLLDSWWPYPPIKRDMSVAYGFVNGAVRPYLFITGWIRALYTARWRIYLLLKKQVEKTDEMSADWKPFFRHLHMPTLSYKGCRKSQQGGQLGQFIFKMKQCAHFCSCQMVCTLIGSALNVHQQRSIPSDRGYPCVCNPCTSHGPMCVCQRSDECAKVRSPPTTSQ